MSELDKPVWLHLDYRDDFEETFQIRITAVDQDYYDSRPTAAYDVKLELGERREILMARHDAVAFIRRPALQALFDDMWRLGFRHQGDSTPGQLQAQQSHIDDLKGIVARLLGIIEERARPIYHIENRSETPPSGGPTLEEIARRMERGNP